MRATLTKAEIYDLESHPTALRILADMHDVCAIRARAVADSLCINAVKVHESRARELRDLADKIESEYQ